MSAKTDKNMHLEHLEDDIINLGYKGAQQSIKFVEALLQLFEGKAKSGVDVTVKWDGAPAIVAGIDPETGYFFVATKHAAFAKTMKLGFNEEMIDMYYDGDLAKILKIAFRELRDVGITGVLQGDIMFTSLNKKRQMIDGVEHITFKPNTIMYAVPTTDPLSKKIEVSNIGVVFHTKYTGSGPVNTLSASFGVDVKHLQSRTAWIEDATYKDVSGKMTLTAAETRTVESKLKSAKTNATAVKKFLDELATHTTDLTIGYMFKIFVNRLVREGKDITKKNLSGFQKFAIDRIVAKENTVKTAKGKDRYIGLKIEIDNYIKKNTANFNAMFSLYQNLVDIKAILVKKLNGAQSIPTFIETETGFKATDPEGFVAIDRKGNAVKLVNRMEFSQANFNAVKDWSKAPEPSETLTKLRTLVFAFGRMNPPTIGHKKLVDKVLSIARTEGAEHLIVLSHTQDKKKNPLDPQTKLNFAQKMFPNVNLRTSDKQLPTFMHFLESFNDKYDKIVMIAGSDRIDEYRRLINSYMGKKYTFKVCDVISAGDRDPDADGASGMSASKMREYAKNNDFKNFRKGLPATFTEANAKALMEAVQQGMQ